MSILFMWNLQWMFRLNPGRKLGAVCKLCGKPGILSELPMTDLFLY